MAKNLTSKQKIAIELLTSGEGLTLKEIAERANVNPKTLYEWRNCPEYTLFQQEVERINNERWRAAEDAAREAAIRLCKEGKTEMVKFVLQNCGYNPTVSTDLKLHTDTIEINIE